jgi:hypothetical protein
MHRRMISRPTGLGGIHALKAQFPQIERVDEGINHTNRIALVDPVIEAFRQQRRLPPIRPRNEPRHPIPRRFSSRIITGPEVLTQPGSEMPQPASAAGRQKSSRANGLDRPKSGHLPRARYLAPVTLEDASRAVGQELGVAGGRQEAPNPPGFGAWASYRGLRPAVPKFRPRDN